MQARQKWVAIFSCLLCALSGEVRAQTRPFRLDDLSLVRGLREPALSPNGRYLVYARDEVKVHTDVTKTAVVLIRVSDGRREALIDAYAARWSPDGHQLALMATRGNRTGLVIYDLMTHTERFLTTVEQSQDVIGAEVDRNFEWSPDGRMVAFIAADPAQPRYLTEGVQEFSRRLYKTEAGFIEGKRSHVWTVVSAGGAPRNLTPGPFDEFSVSWSADGQRLTFASNRSENPDSTYAPQIWSVDLAGGLAVRITHAAAAFRPRYSPRGPRLLYSSWLRPELTRDSPAEDPHQWTIETSTQATLQLGPNIDRPIWAAWWWPDGNSVVLAAQDQGRETLIRVGLGDTIASPLVSRCDCVVRSFSVDASGKQIAYLRETPQLPAEVWIANADGSGARQLTREQSAFVSRIRPLEMQPFRYSSWDGTTVEGFAFKPAGSGSVPTVLAVHGGPHGAHGYYFDPELQALTASGFGVLAINPRGSSGYGQRFSDGTLGDWGGGDYRDLMTAIDSAAVRFAWIDTSRLAIVGHSYGGYMANWAVTQTNRFRAAVSASGVSNLLSFIGTSAVADLIDAEYGHASTERDIALWKRSPISHALRARTPTLLLHGESDNLVPISQSEEMYAALVGRGVPTTLVRYSGTGHGFERPTHYVDRLRRELQWLAKYLGSSTPGPRRR